MIALALAMWAGAAHAHHDTAVGRVGGSGIGAAANRWLDLPAPRWTLRIGYEAVDFGRVLRGNAPFDDGSGRGLGVHLLTLGGSWTGRSGLFVDASLPLGLTASRGTTSQLAAGLGDPELGVGTTVWLSDRNAERPVTLRVRASLTAPVGSYALDPAFTLTAVDGGADGALTVTTYDTRASLGLGAFAITGTAGLSWDVGPLAVLVDVGARQPLHPTVDGIWWGTDGLASLGAAAPLFGGEWVAAAGVQGQIHGADQLDVLNEDTGEPVVRRVGRRMELAATVEIAARVGQRVVCSLSGRVPALQAAQGLQLVSTWSATAQCAMHWPAARPKPR